MRNAEEFHRRSGTAQASRCRQAAPDAGGRRPGPGRIRYAHGGVWPRVEPYCTVAHGAGDGCGAAVAADDDVWLTEFPVGDRQASLRGLICGGLATAAAFVAAFVAASGMAGYPAMPAGLAPAMASHGQARSAGIPPESAMSALMSQACPALPRAAPAP